MDLLNLGPSCSICRIGCKGHWGLDGCISTSESISFVFSISTVGFLDPGVGVSQNELLTYLWYLNIGCTLKGLGVIQKFNNDDNDD